jgi:hypothetical protein
MGVQKSRPGEKGRARRKKITAEVKASDKARIRTGRNLSGRPSTPPTSQSKLKKMGYCAAKKKTRDETGGANIYCMKKAGWGTDHQGVGSCKYHGGSTASHRASAERRRQIEFMGRPKDISPLDAIIWAIKIAAGEVEWLGSQIAEINNKNDWIEFTIQGQQLHVFQRARGEAMDRLVKYSKDAIALGLAERAVRMAEQFGATLARLLEGIYADMKPYLLPEGTSVWPIVVRKHLILLEGGSLVKDSDRRALPPGVDPVIDAKKVA